MREFVAMYRKALAGCFDEILPGKLEEIIETFLRAQSEGRRVFFLGNGGSASTASHMAVDFGKGTWVQGQPRLRAISLTDNVGLITAWANDACYECIFEEQLRNLLEPNDIVVAISASGNSPNVLKAAKYARQRGAITIGLIGFGGGELKNLVDIDITVSSKNYGQVEDFHLSVNHILSQYLRREIRRRIEKEETIYDSAVHLKFVFSKPPTAGIRPGILIDRDGVINEQVVGGYVTDWKQFHFREGITSALTSLAEMDFPVIVVSNQAGVSKRLVSCSALEGITKRFVMALAKAGARVDAVYYCPHTPDQNCSCRKPRSGLLEAAARDWRLDLTRSVFIGDSESDLRAARTVKCQAILVSSENHGADAILAGEHIDAEVRVVKDTSTLAPTVRNILQPRQNELAHTASGSKV